MLTYFRLFLLEQKRFLKKLPILLFILALLISICLGFGYGILKKKQSQETPVSAYTVVVCLPEHASLYYKMAFNMVSQMESLKTLCTIIKTEDEKLARDMLAAGEASAVVLVPSGFLTGIVDGTNYPMTILYPGEPSIETVLFRNTADSLARMLSSAQSGVYTLYEIYRNHNQSDSVQNTANAELNQLYIDKVLSRSDLIVHETIHAESDRPLYTTIVAGGLCLITLLSGICLVSLLTPKDPALSHALTRLGISPLSRGIFSLFGAWMVLFLLLAIVCFFLIKTGVLALFFPAATASLFVALAITVFFAVCVLYCIVRLVRTQEASVLTLFFASFLSVLLAGGLIPSAFLPKLFSLIAVYTPVYHVIGFLSDALCGTLTLRDSVLVFAMGIFFLLLPFLYTAIKPLGMFLSSRCHIPHRQSNKKGLSLRVSQTKAIGWLIFLGKRLLRRPFLWLLAACLLLLGIWNGMRDTHSNFIRVGLFCEQPSAQTQAVLDRLVNDSTGHLYQFYLADSKEALTNDILWGNCECGYLLSNNLVSDLMEQTPDAIHTLLGPTTVLAPLIDEEVYGAAFFEAAPYMLSSYITSSKTLRIKPDILWREISEQFSYWEENGETFHLEYEDVSPDFFDNSAAFSFPFRGLFSLFLLVAALAGILQYRHDREKQSILPRYRFEQHILPAVYSAFFLLLPAIAGFFALLLGGEIQSIGLEMIALLFYMICLILFSTLLHKLIRQETAFSFFIPFLIVFCLLYTPILADLWRYLPFGNVLRYFAPCQWYLCFQ